MTQTKIIPTKSHPLPKQSQMVHVVEWKNEGCHLPSLRPNMYMMCLNECIAPIYLYLDLTSCAGLALVSVVVVKLNSEKKHGDFKIVIGINNNVMVFVFIFHSKLNYAHILLFSMTYNIHTIFGSNIRPGHHSRMCFKPLGIYVMSF
jgi:hypothetical protein